jgi:tight adherence protein B
MSSAAIALLLALVCATLVLGAPRPPAARRLAKLGSAQAPAAGHESIRRWAPTRWGPAGWARSGRPPDIRIAVRALAEELASGALPSDGWVRASALAGSAGPAFEAAGAAAGRGSDVGAALRAAAGPDEALARLSAAWQCSGQSGASASDVLRRWVDDADARVRAGEAQRVALAGPRASALLLAGLPLLGLGLGAAMGADPLAALTGSPFGAACAVVGSLLDIAGLCWMRRIVRSAARA